MAQLISLFDIRPILDPLTKGQLLLTPNQRLASRIASSYSIHCTRSGQASVINSANVNSINSWIDNCWQQLLIAANSEVLEFTTLSAAQEQVLWESIVQNSVYGTALLRPTATAMQVSSAYRSLIEWDQDINSTTIQQLLSKDEDSSALLEWINCFELRCANKHWMPSVKRIQLIINAFNAGDLEKMGSIFTVAFESIAPLYRRLLEVAGKQKNLEFGKKASSVVVTPCESPQQELLAAAVWAKQVLRNNENATIGIVIPDLAQQRQVVQRTLQEVFETSFSHLPDDISIPTTKPTATTSVLTTSNATTRNNLPFNMSAGYPLIEAPVISAALDCLTLQLPSADIETLEATIQSPFYGQESDDDFVLDFECRAQLIQLIRSERKFSLSSARFRQLAAKAMKNVFSSVAEDQSQQWSFSEKLQLQANYSRSVSISNPRSLLDWSDVFQALLTDSGLGWPGKRILDSIEYQQVSQWSSVIEELSSLDLILTTNDNLLSFGEAISQLRAVLSRRVFQPQTIDSPLQVLGTLEAAGLKFTHLWLHSMADHQWPQSPSPNPLLPNSLQRQESMPHSSAERELLFARNVSDQFLHGSENIVISFGRSSDDKKCNISPIFADYPIVELEQLLGTSLVSRVPNYELRRRHFESASVQTIPLDKAPVLRNDEKVKGGSGLFANQSACPFKAFVTNRLGIKSLENPEIGLNAAQRGSLLHRSLELTWDKLKSRQKLLLLTDVELKQLCQDTSTYAVNEYSLNSNQNTFGKRFQSLEISRLKQLLIAWLTVEKERSDFFVEALEQRKTFRFEQLELETRIDRIDRLSDNSLLVIDYKTGATNINRWWGQRPDEPQLPLYSMLIEADEKETVGGIAFAQLRAEKIAFSGVGDENLPEEKIKWQGKIQSDSGVVDWENMKTHWSKVLTALAEDFIHGVVDIDPKNPPTSCQYCQFPAICRIKHQDLSL